MTRYLLNAPQANHHGIEHVCLYNPLTLGFIQSYCNSAIGYLYTFETIYFELFFA